MMYHNKCDSAQFNILFRQAELVSCILDKEGFEYGILRVKPFIIVTDSSVMSMHYQSMTLSKIQDQFYFPGYRGYIYNKCITCLPCIKKNKSVPALQHQLHHEYSS